MSETMSNDRDHADFWAALAASPRPTRQDLDEADAFFAATADGTPKGMTSPLPARPARVKSAHQVDTEQRIGELARRLPTRILDPTDPADVHRFYAE